MGLRDSNLVGGNVDPTHFPENKAGFFESLISRGVRYGRGWLISHEISFLKKLLFV